MNMDKQGLEFGKLLELFKQTQATMQTQAARANGAVVDCFKGQPNPDKYNSGNS